MAQLIFRFSIFLCGFFLLVTASAGARAHSFSESVLSLSNGMIATEVSIDNLDSHQAGEAVLLIHGWAGQMDEVGDMYKRLAHQLADQGIASLRINVRGESEHELTNYRLTSTFESRVTDAQTGLDYLLKNYPGARIGLVGFSLGGATAMRLIGANPQAVDSLVLWSTVGDPAVLFASFTNEQRRTVLDQGELILPYWADLTITRRHMLGFDGYDVFTGLKEYQGALLSIRGTEDHVLPQEQKILASAAASPEEIWVIEGADHIFNALDPGSEYDERLINRTLAWLAETLD